MPDTAKRRRKRTGATDPRAQNLSLLKPSIPLKQSRKKPRKEIYSNPKKHKTRKRKRTEPREGEREKEGIEPVEVLNPQSIHLFKRKLMGGVRGFVL